MIHAINFNHNLSCVNVNCTFVHLSNPYRKTETWCCFNPEEARRGGRGAKHPRALQKQCRDHVCAPLMPLPQLQARQLPKTFLSVTECTLNNIQNSYIEVMLLTLKKKIYISISRAHHHFSKSSGVEVQGWILIDQQKEVVIDFINLWNMIGLRYKYAFSYRIRTFNEMLSPLLSTLSMV